MLFHIVFTTKDRRPFIKPEVQPRLYSYLSALVHDRFGRPIRIGGVEDHVHMLIDKNPGVNEPDMLRDIKANSSRWMRKTFPEMADFAWQVGYGIFSVSAPHRQMVAEYIKRQPSHHRRVTFRDEFMRLLKRNNVEYDERYLL